LKAGALLLLPVLLAACAGGGPKNATIPADDLTAKLAAAFEEEATGSPPKARSLYLDVVERAAREPSSAWHAVTLEAGLDALVLRSVPSFAAVTESSALAYRTDDPTELAGDGGMPHALPGDAIGTRLAALYKDTDGPFARGLLSRAMQGLAEHRGDVKDAALWRERSGCAREALVIGPLDWAPVTGVHRPDPLEAFDAKIDKTYPARGPLVPDAIPALARGHGCALDLGAPSPITGVRDVVVDLDVPKAARIAVALRAHGEATLRVGGKLVLERPYELGGDTVARFAQVDVGAGKLRVVARVGMDTDGGTVEIDAWDDHGAPLALHAPHVGDAGSARAGAAEPTLTPAAKTDSERLALTLGALAVGDGRTAERLLEGLPASAPPALHLAYARAVENAEDLSPVERSERARSAYERVLEAWPSAWEAILAHAMLAGARRGEGDARIEMLRDLDGHRATAGTSAAPLLDAFDAATSAKEHLFDRAHAAYEKARTSLEKTGLLTAVGKVSSERTGKDRAAYVCSPLPPHDRDTLECFASLRDSGDLTASQRELERLRAVRGGEDLFLAFTLKDAIARRDPARAAQTLGRMTPGEVSLSDLYAVADLAPKGSPDPASRLHDAVTIARDAPSAWPVLLRALGDDPTRPFAGIAEDLRQKDRAHTILESAATAVLAHTERYDVDKVGLVHALLFDVRRVSGTADVEENAQAEAPELLGRSTMRVLRRRILKRDGRIVEPDPTPRASQGHADLSQLEAGDLVEAIYEGWAVPGETGDIGIDTPDLLPERTSVHEGTIELSFPRSLAPKLWSHPLLGKASERALEDRTVLSFHMQDQGARRIEEGTPKMDRSVSVSLGTASWKTFGEGLREATASLDSHDPEIAAWTAKAVSGAGENVRAKVETIVRAAGSSVKEASASALTDVAFGRAEGPQRTTARTILTNREGSRTWLIVQALHELGIAADVVVAENDPFSATESFPPHPGRFLHPLVVAHVPAPAPAQEELVWIDADVPGPPLPAGRISPELRGRSALHADGSVSPLPVTSMEGDKDEIDLRLSVLPNGDAKGTFTIVLRGREAQEIAEMLLRVVGDDRQKALRGVALAWVPFADVDHVVLSSSEESWQIAIRADLSILSYAESEKGPFSATASATGAGSLGWLLPGLDPLHTVYPRPFSGTLGATYAAQGKRQSALAVSHAVQYHAHRRIELPKGAKITALPGPLDLKGPHLDASRKITVTGNVIEDDFTLGVPTGTVAPGEYEGFVTNIHRTDDAFLAATRVHPESPSKP
jgi:hypothetical protein